MAFQEIKPVETADTYLDIAIARAKKKAAALKVKGDRFEKIKTLEMHKLAIVRDILTSRLDEVQRAFPKVHELSEFYQKLVEHTIGKADYKGALNRLRWSTIRIDEMFKRYNAQMKRSSHQSHLKRAKKEFYGRISSFLKTIDFDYLKKARITLQSFPIIKKKYKQIAIAGFPNVGKSTLLSKLSGSKPEIAAYAFTTKGIMIGYIKDKDIQLLDTPGTLNRVNKMNDIEMQAYLVMKYVADRIIYVFDLTEPYPLKDQIKLYQRIKDLGKPVIIYLSKTDIIKKEKIEEFSKRYAAADDTRELKKAIYSKRN